MKHSSYLKISLAVLALAGAQSSGAAVLAGFYDFVGDKLTNPPPNNPANVVAPGMIAWVESPLMSAQGGGGDMGGFYGNSSIPVGVAPSWGDGHAVIKMFGTTSSTVKFSLTNTNSYSVDLSRLFFDAAASTGQFGRSVQVDFINPLNPSGTPLGVFPGTGGLTPTSPADFDDFGVSLGSYVMAGGETVSFVFSAPAGMPNGTVLWIDNVAIVPEPSSLMAFGSMLMTGLMFRRRKG
jgi:hypothetical protein